MPVQNLIGCLGWMSLAVAFWIGEPALAQNRTVDAGRGEIRARSGRSAWTWDGRMLRPKFPGTGHDAWQFNGRKFTRMPSGKSTSAASPDAWTWTGDELRPTFGAASGNIYVYKDGEFRPKYGPKHDGTWQLSGGVWKPKQGATLDNSWTVKGDVPTAVIGMVLLGLVE